MTSKACSFVFVLYYLGFFLLVLYKVLLICLFVYRHSGFSILLDYHRVSIFFFTVKKSYL